MRFHLNILTPDASILQDHVDSVRVPAADGMYELLPNHAPIFLALRSGTITVRQSNETECWFIVSGSCHMANNKCTIVITEIIDMDEISVDTIETSIKDNVDPNFSNKKREILEAQLAYKKA